MRPFGGRAERLFRASRGLGGLVLMSVQDRVVHLELGYLYRHRCRCSQSVRWAARVGSRVTSVVLLRDSCVSGEALTYLRFQIPMMLLNARVHRGQPRSKILYFPS